MSVEYLRVWLANGYDISTIRHFISKDFIVGNPCLMCILCKNVKIRCVVKVGSLWFEVHIIFGGENEHINDGNHFERLGIHDAAVVMEYEHIIRYHPTHLAQLDELQYGRIIRYFHRLLRLRTLVDRQNPASVNLVTSLVISSLRAIRWHVDHKYIISFWRMLSFLCEGQRYVTFSIPKALHSIEYLSQQLCDKTVIMSEYDFTRMRRFASQLDIHVRT